MCAAIVAGALTADKLVLVSPSPDMNQLLAAYGRALHLAPRAQAALGPLVENYSHGSLADFDVAALGATGKLPEGLVIHDRLDQEVRYETTQRIVGGWPGVDLMTTSGLGHHRILKDPGVVARVTSELCGRATG